MFWKQWKPHPDMFRCRILLNSYKIDITLPVLWRKKQNPTEINQCWIQTQIWDYRAQFLLLSLLDPPDERLSEAICLLERPLTLFNNRKVRKISYFCDWLSKDVLYMHTWVKYCTSALAFLPLESVPHRKEASEALVLFRRIFFLIKILNYDCYETCLSA